ncbi:hypothetical protein IFO70_19360 [Phormidium tenue FACHB-886]|nr:hypothetical protein [Phormidium tenue FACHB-886]
MTQPDPLSQESQTQTTGAEAETPSLVKSVSATSEADSPVIFAQLESKVCSTAISPDGRRMIAGLGNGTLQFFDLISGNPIGPPLQGHSDAVLSVAFSPDGKTIVSGSADRTIRLWSIGGNIIGPPLQGHSDAVLSVAFSPDGKTIVSGSADRTIRLWSIKGNIIGPPLQGHLDIVLSVAFSPDGKTIVSGSNDIRLWSIEGAPIGPPWAHSDAALSVAFSPNGKTIVSGSVDGTIRLWSIEGIPIGQPLQGHSGSVNSVAFSPDGKTIVSGSVDSTIRLWSIEGIPIGQPLQVYLGSVHTSVNSVDFSPDGKTIVSGSDDRTIRLWSIEGIPIAPPLQGHSRSVNSVAFSPDGKTIVSGSDDRTIRLWSIEGIPIAPPWGHSDSVNSVAFSPDGKTIVSGSGDRTIRLWSIEGTPIGQPLQGHSDSIRSVAFSPDGRTIVSGSNDGTIRLWSIEGIPIGQLLWGHSNYVLSVAFSPDGKTIVSGTGDRTIRLWSIEGTPIGQPLQGYSSSVNSVAFSPDGKTIVSGSGDTSVSLWQLDASSTVQRLWVMPIAIATPIRNLEDRSRQISVPQSIANDLAQGEDQLKVKDEIDALATVLLLRSLEPPIAVGILGSWGSGKSFGMNMIRRKANEIRRQSLSSFEAWGDPGEPTRTDILFPYVGHIYQIEFNAWTYAKADLWASLMQEIFYELNRQISLEQQLGRILSTPPQERPAQSTALEPARANRYTDQFIYNPIASTRRNFLNKIQQFFRRLSIILQKTLNLWLSQFIIHVLVFVLIVPVRLLVLIIALLDKLSGENFDLLTKLSNFLEPFFDWLVNQFENYYSPSNLRTSFDTWVRRIESILEHVLFLLLVGFPKRLSNRRQYWQRISSQSAANSPATQSSSELNSVAYGEALRKGGNFWLRNEKELLASSEISNSLWKALEKIKQEEQKRFKEKELQLQEKEKELQRQLKSAEVGVDQKLAQRRKNAFWAPIANAIARLRFSGEEIEQFAATGETTRMLRQTFTSWQGLLALFTMTLFIVLTLDSANRTAIITATQTLLEKTGLLPLLDRLIPAGVKNTFTSLSQIIPIWLDRLPRWITTLQAKIPAGIQVLAAITAVVTALIPILKALSNYITLVQKEQARIQSERDVLLKQEQSKAEGLIKEVAQLKLQIEEQRQRVGLTADYASLMDFVNDRLRVDDYGKRLGLMQQVKQDLAVLSDYLAGYKHNREEFEKCFPRGPVRVILYIDDLDRCPPNRVVEVLEAVQLLLNTRLFIVVLGIDDRYIARALEQVYRGVLKRGGKPSGIDYLEKIIQIPYRMRPISPATVENYLRAQLQLRRPDSSADPQTVQQAIAQSDRPFQQEQADTSQDGNSSLQAATPPMPAQASVAQSSEAIDSLNPPVQTSQQLPTQSSVEFPATEPAIQKSEARPPEEMPDPIEISQAPAAQTNGSTPSSQTTADTDSKTYLETVAKVTELDETEFQLLVDCCKRVDITPRTAKRLINIYKILQIIWSTRSQNTPLQPQPSTQTKRVVMSFLALSGRYPSYMRNLFEEIDVKLEEQMGDAPDTATADNPQLDIELDALLNDSTPQPATADSYAQREWRKFRADINQMLRDPEKPPNQSIQLTLDRSTFDLMLSFCFMGDIGYDPDDYHLDTRLSKNQDSTGTPDCSTIATENGRS